MSIMISSLKLIVGSILVVFPLVLLLSSSESKSSFRRLSSTESKDFLSSNTKDPWKRELFSRLGRIREVCGELCSIESLDDFNRKAQNINGHPTFTANVDCDRLMNSEDVDAGDLSFPTQIPEELVPFYTLNGVIPIVPYRQFFKDAYLNKKALSNIWKKEDVEKMIQQVKEGTLEGTYSAFLVEKIKSKLAVLDLKGKNVLVIGSEYPWVEATCLALGATKVTTLEYGSILSLHPQIEALTPKAFREKYSAGSLKNFDGVVSISSLEHSGLGRYGDALNPWGDLIAAGRAWCVTKSSGFLLLSVPGGTEDSIQYNAHRVYGRYRWPLITTNWEVQDLDMNKNYLNERTSIQSIHSFKKIDARDKYISVA